MPKLELREDYLLDGYSLANAGSYTHKIKFVDPCMDLYIKLEAQNGAQGNYSNFLFDVVEYIEIVDGSDVLFHLDPEQLLALDLYHYKESLHIGLDERPNEIQTCVLKIPFSRERYDPLISFDPTRFKNPVFKIKWNLAAVNAIGLTGFVDGSLYLDLIATIAEKYPARPEGFFMHKHKYDWETAGAGDEPIELPTDHPYRTLFMRVKESDYLPWNVITEAKLDVDEGKWIPFEWHTDDWMLWLKEWYGMWHWPAYWWLSTGTGGLVKEPFLAANLAMALLGKDAFQDPWWSNLTGCNVGISTSTAVTSGKLHAKLDGTLPFNTWAWPHGDPEDPEEWLPAPDHKHIFLYATQDIAEQTGQVFLTQYRKY